MGEFRRSRDKWTAIRPLLLLTILFVASMLGTGQGSSVEVGVDTVTGIESTRPELLSWGGEDSGSISIIWSYTEPENVTIDGFVVQYSLDSGFSQFTNVTVWHDERMCIITGLDDDQYYYIRILAYDGDSLSQWSETVEAQSGPWREGLGIEWWYLPAFILLIAGGVALVVFVVYKLVKLRKV